MELTGVSTMTRNTTTLVYNHTASGRIHRQAGEAQLSRPHPFILFCTTLERLVSHGVKHVLLRHLQTAIWCNRCF